MEVKILINIEELKKQEFNELAKAREIDCPDKNHIVFSRFYELSKKYKNTAYIKYVIKNKFKNRMKVIGNKTNELQNDIDFYRKMVDKEETLKRLDEEFKMTKEQKKRFDKIDINACEAEIDALNKEKSIIEKWMKIVIGNKENLTSETGLAKDENNLFSEIITEFFNIYKTTVNIRPVGQLKSNIFTHSLKNEEILSKLADELSKQIGLCIEGGTGEYFYSDGDGKFIPFTKENNMHILKYIHEGIIFDSPKGIKGGYTLNIDDIFEKVPKWINVIRYKNPELVGFNNCFYDITKEQTLKLEPKIPLLPLRTILTELYLDEKIDGGALEDIFNQCFTEEDKKDLLAYIGCCLYDKGYTQRQESIFLISIGGIGKTTFINAITSIFYNTQTQGVKKLDDAKFGLSPFAEADCIIMDEIQNATDSFPEHLKTISTGANLPVEKKNKDTINIPAEIVPRCWFVGNKFPKKIYDAIAGEGVSRRIIPIVPIKSFIDCGYKESELFTDDCKRWLVQQATKTYIELGLNSKSKSFSPKTNEEKMHKIHMCTFPEEYFLKKHFDIVYQNGYVDMADDKLILEDVQNFVYDKISEKMLEATIRKDNSQTFSIAVKNAFNVNQSSYIVYSRLPDGKNHMNGLVPKSKEAIKYFEDLYGEKIWSERKTKE